ncbi:MAG: hypothetical protein OXC19_08215 [Bryobacterales bacterium]|nr:hypothetical protein [Bryobacterales bacterium]
MPLAIPDTPAPTEAILGTLDPVTRHAALQALGWHPDHITVVDEDLGLSG